MSQYNGIEISNYEIARSIYAGRRNPFNVDDEYQVSGVLFSVCDFRGFDVMYYNPALDDFVLLDRLDCLDIECELRDLNEWEAEQGADIAATERMLYAL